MLMIRLVLAVVLALATPALAQSQAPRGPERFGPEIEAFAAADRQSPPKPCGFLFVGSSSIRFWKTLKDDMAPYPVINRGFGGSTVADVNHFFDQVVRPYRPRAIVFYAGENDLAAGKTPAEAAADFTRFLELKAAALGATPVYFITAKPSKLRWEQRGQQAAFNDAVRKIAGQRRDLQVVDVVGPMLKDGQPRDIFVADDLHMTPAGYVIWTEVVRPVVVREASRPTTCKAA